MEEEQIREALTGFFFSLSAIYPPLISALFGGQLADSWMFTNLIL